MEKKDRRKIRDNRLKRRNTVSPIDILHSSIRMYEEIEPIKPLFQRISIMITSDGELNNYFLMRVVSYVWVHYLMK